MPIPDPIPDYTCECEPSAGQPVRSLYVVTHHDGTTTTCAYCNDCADLAADDWNGETAAIAPYAYQHQE